jgi:hypothetical protein
VEEVLQKQRQHGGKVPGWGIYWDLDVGVTSKEGRRTYWIADVLREEDAEAPAGMEVQQQVA